MLKERMDGRKKSMADGIKVLCGNRWKGNDLNAAILISDVINEMRTIIDGDFMTSPEKSNRQLFIESFKAAVAGRYAPASEKGDS